MAPIIPHDRANRGPLETRARRVSARPLPFVLGEQANRTSHASPAQAAVPVNVAREVLLVVVLGVVEGAGGGELGGDGRVVGLGELGGVGVAGALGGGVLGLVGVV